MMTLAGNRYISLTTFREDGSPVATPVWVVSDDGERLLVWTASSTAKVRRVRGNPRVRVAPCTFRGRETGEPVAGEARVLAGSDAETLVTSLLRRKYGLQKRALEIQSAIARRFGRSSTNMTILEIRPQPEARTRVNDKVGTVQE